ncbi:hypothetical protein C4J81_16560 [Deltaproteobacteria bacterium Smac51]|nr:hypothetical protein C4J81_16560 [Deltaproteobacteria bacterium Smac51]
MPLEGMGAPIEDGFRSTSREFQMEIFEACCFFRSQLAPDSPHYNFIGLEAARENLQFLVKKVFNIDPRSDNEVL